MPLFRRRNNMATKKQSPIAKKNEEFNGLSPEKRRVAIARDVIRQVEAERLLPTKGVYLVPNPLSSYMTYGKEILVGYAVGDDLKKIFKKEIETCNCCAKGALFLSAVEKYNQCKVTDNMRASAGTSFTNEEVSKQLRKHFSHDQLELIESAFEGRWSEGNKTNYFHDSYINSYERMQAIMKNIIANKGTFVP
jgi:hypothetical protein